MRVPFLAAVLAVCASPAALCATPSKAEVEAAATQLMARAYRDDGVGAVVLIARGDEVLFRAAKGRREIDNAADLRVDDVFPIASITKQFVAAAILRLVDEGRIGLDDPVSKFLPDFPDGQRILIRQLLNHTAGVTEYVALPELASAPPGKTTLSDLMQALRGKPLDFAPGEKHVYSNSGYIVLAAVLEAVTGKSWTQAIADDVTTPLGLASTGDGDDAALAARQPKAYLPEDGGYVPAPPYPLSFASASGAMVSTADDLFRWTRALHGGRVVSDSLYKRMVTPEGAAAQGDAGYGFAMERASVLGHPTLGHSGWLAGYLSQVTYLPDAQITIIVLENTDASGPLGSAPIMAIRLAALALGEPMPLPSAQQPDAAALAQYAGVYRAGESERVVRVVDGGLTIQKTGAARWKLSSFAPDDFVRADTLHAVHFERGAEGRITGLRVGYQDGELGPVVARTNDPLPPVKVSVPVPRATLEGLVGSYWRSGTVLRITFDGRTLRCHVLGQTPTEMIATSPTRFDVPAAGASIQFDAGSPAPALILFQHGAENRFTRMEATQARTGK